MWDWFKKLGWPFQVGIAILILVSVVLVWEKGGTWYAHYKWGKSDKQVTETLDKSDQLAKESAEHKAKADLLESQAAAKDNQIKELTEINQKYGAQAAQAAQAVNQSYADLTKEQQAIQNMSEDELRNKICQDRKDLGFPPVGQCKGWKPPQ
jgi:hypothetical protein